MDPAVIPEEKKDWMGGFVGVGVDIAYFSMELWVSSGCTRGRMKPSSFILMKGLRTKELNWKEYSGYFPRLGLKESLSRRAIIPWVLESRRGEVVETKQICGIAVAESQRGDLNIRNH